MQATDRLYRFAQKPPREKLRIVYHKLSSKLPETDWYWKIHSPGNHRTTYIIGLFGTGRLYINDLVQQHIGERAKYFRDKIRLHRGPTSMIYSGHATLKHVSRGQAPPEVTARVVAAVRLGHADLIFLYRHPLDSILTNWFFWSSVVRGDPGTFVSFGYKNTDDLCADLDRNFAAFVAFAEGDPAFFAAAPGLPFLSFKEFVEETELHLQSATLTLKLEDFMIDPVREFSKIAEVMGVKPDLRHLHVPPPHTRPYRYLEVQEKVPQFRSFIQGLDLETKRRVEKIGYRLGC